MNLEQKIREVATKNNIELTPENQKILLRDASIELSKEATPKEVLAIVKQICK